MAEQTTGILGSQSRLRDTATKSREGNKGFLKRFMKPVVVFFAVVIPLLLWWRQDGEKFVAEVMASSVRTPVQQVQKPRQDDWYGKKETVVVTKESPMTPIMVPGGRCIRWWGPNPEGKTFTAYVRDVNDPTWYTFGEYRKKFPGRGFGWVKYAPIETEATIYYAFYRLNECG